MIINHASHAWTKSSYCGQNDANCVETAVTPAALLVHDSKRTDGLVLAVSAGAWRAFVAFAVSV